MVAASTNLQEVFPHMYIDAAVGRQAESLATDLTNAKAKMPNPDAYLIGLGTNGTIKADEIEAAMKVAGNKPVYWMNIHADRVWAKPNNNLLTKTAKKYKNLKIIDWNKKHRVITHGFTVTISIQKEQVQKNTRLWWQTV